MDGHNNQITIFDPNSQISVKVTLNFKPQVLNYRKQIARQLCTQYVESIYTPKYYTVTLKSRLRSLKVTNETIG